VCGAALNFTIIALLQRSSIPPLSDVLAEIRAQCVQYASLTLQGVLSEEELPRTSPLLGPVLNQSLPRGFLPELVARTHATHELFSKVGNVHTLVESKYIILCYQYFSKFNTFRL
jgi:ubiquitin conjugation factor E4 B